MPYIKQSDRIELLTLERPAATAGELNYLLTQELIKYIENKGLTYQTINDILGALEGVKNEFYVRVVTPYEWEKHKENGDVYPDFSLPIGNRK